MWSPILCGLSHSIPIFLLRPLRSGSDTVFLEVSPVGPVKNCTARRFFFLCAEEATLLVFCTQTDEPSFFYCYTVFLGAIYLKDKCAYRAIAVLTPIAPWGVKSRAGYAVVSQEENHCFEPRGILPTSWASQVGGGFSFFRPCSIQLFELCHEKMTR